MRVVALSFVMALSSIVHTQAKTITLGIIEPGAYIVLDRDTERFGTEPFTGKTWADIGLPDLYQPYASGNLLGTTTGLDLSLPDNPVFAPPTPVVADYFFYFLTYPDENIGPPPTRYASIEVRDPDGNRIGPAIFDRQTPGNRPPGGLFLTVTEDPPPPPPPLTAPEQALFEQCSTDSRRLGAAFCDGYARAAAAPAPDARQARFLSCFEQGRFGFGGASGPPSCVNALLFEGGTSISANDPNSPDQTDSCGFGDPACTLIGSFVAPGMEIASISIVFDLDGSPYAQTPRMTAGFAARAYTDDVREFFAAAIGVSDDPIVPVPLPGAIWPMLLAMLAMVGLGRSSRSTRPA